MNVNQKGVKGLIRVIDDLQDKNYYVFPAFDDHSPIDLVAVDKKGQTFRLQIKYRELMKDKKSQRYELSAKSVVNGKVVPVNTDMIDGWAMFLANHNRVVYINKSQTTKSGLIINPDINYGGLDEWFKSAPC